uniref:tRNA 5-hydroxyuridine modification protein YegQ n=1 Tax=Candidatus Aschnera chinzeii TaxID=1485666 RepID=A0AAT9G420_9ENTR|nr:MAG: tRNA 5-hydroxyuridine modification protein YegQ [Candidatus Aschnera chinzeii]
MLIAELLSPAGTLKSMRYAFAYGADAVYAGLPRYSLRVRNNEFDIHNLHIGIQEAHHIGKYFYIVINIIPHNFKLKSFLSDIKNIINLNPDALIISDPGLIMLTKEAYPEIKIHLSVQANAINWATVKFWHNYGINRIILSRELSIEEIKEIREEVPEIELEVFIHGALCIAYSGRCLLSSYLSKRDANQGTCTNACRWSYNINKDNEKNVNNISKYIDNHKSNQSTTTQQILNQTFLITEKKNKQNYMYAHEDEHGTYIFNSKDLRAVQYIKQLIDIGICSFKIEGRTKSFYYCARTTQIYRTAINDALAGIPFNMSLLHELDGLANRGYTEGFLVRHNQLQQTYTHGYSVSKKQEFVGEFTGKYKHGMAEIEVKNKFYLNDNFILMLPNGNLKIRLSNLLNIKYQNITVAPGAGHKVYTLISNDIDLKYGILIRNLNNFDE